ncbi:ferritin-like domain-containing protein [Williamsia sp. SKLECPSW1]
MAVSTTPVRTQLSALLTLTHTEIQIAQTRVTQARTEAVARELTQNAANGRTRAVAIEEALRELDGLPEIIRPLVGRGIAAGKTILEQAQPLDEALLGDLQLEYQLLGRARYLKALATAHDLDAIVDLADTLISAHTATVNWLTTVLAEEAIGGPAALRRTPVQWASGLVATAVTLPGTVVARGADRVIDGVVRIPQRIGGLRSAAKGTTENVAVTVTAGRDAALEAAEDAARDTGATVLADTIHSARAATGTVGAEDLPIADYDDLTVTAAVAAIKDLEKASDIRLVVDYEEAHKNRQGVVSAAQTQLAAIAKDVVGVE